MNPGLTQFSADADQLVTEALAAFRAAANPDALEAARIQFLGDRSGRLRTLQQTLGQIAKEDKPQAGKIFNGAKMALTDAFGLRERELRASAGDSADIDLT